MKQAIFNDMRIASFAEKNEISFTVILEDSVFASAATCLLKQPVDINELDDISTCIGRYTWLPLKKIRGRENFYGQGSLNASELEITLPRKNDKPSFPRSFPLYASEFNSIPAFIIGTAELDEFLSDGYYGKVFYDGLRKGMTVEIHSGKGAGGKCTIVDIAIEDPSNLRMVKLTLSPDPADKVQGIEDSRYALRPPSGLTATPSYFHPKIIFPSSDKSLESLENVSFWRIMNTNQIYFVYFGKKNEMMSIPNYPNIGITNADGSIYEIGYIEMLPVEKGDGYQLFIDVSNIIREDKILLSDVIPMPPRYDMDNGTLLFCKLPPYPCSFAEYRYNCERAQLSSASDKVPLERAIVFEVPKNTNASELVGHGSQISVYWRIEEMGDLSNVDSVCPHFLVGPDTSRRGGGDIIWRPIIRVMLLDDSLTTMESKGYFAQGYPTQKEAKAAEIAGVMKSMPEKIADAITFEKGSLVNAKYLYLQIGVQYADGYAGESFDLCFYTYGLKRKASYPLEKARVKAYRDDIIHDPVQLAWMLCGDNDIAVNPESMAEASKAISNDIYGNKRLFDTPRMEVANGASWEEKLSELCRAANISLFSDGCRLHAKYWIADRLKENVELSIDEKDIVAGSCEITGFKNEGIYTDYVFSLPTEQKVETLRLSAPGKNDVFWDDRIYADDWVLEVDGAWNVLFNDHYTQATLMMSVRLPESSVYAGKEFIGLIPGNSYEISFKEENLEHSLDMLFLDMRLRETHADCIFELGFQGNKERVYEVPNANGITIRPLRDKKEPPKAIGGSLSVDRCSAEWLWLRTQAALAEIKNHIKMDERYTKHKVMAFTSPETWLKSILNTVAHNTYKKILVKFSVPLDMLPEGGLHTLILNHVRLEFGRFKKYPINGWIIGYSLNVAEDKVDITFLSSEAMKNSKWYDENDLTDQKILNETESSDKLITEVL